MTSGSLRSEAGAPPKEPEPIKISTPPPASEKQEEPKAEPKDEGKGSSPATEHSAPEPGSEHHDDGADKKAAPQRSRAPIRKPSSSLCERAGTPLDRASGPPLPRNVRQMSYADRRKALMQKFPGGVAVFPSAPVAIRNNDVEHEYRQDSDLYYLTGFDEPETRAGA